MRRTLDQLFATTRLVVGAVERCSGDAAGVDFGFGNPRALERDEWAGFMYDVSVFARVVGGGTQVEAFAGLLLRALPDARLLRHDAAVYVVGDDDGTLWHVRCGDGVCERVWVGSHVEPERVVDEYEYRCADPLATEAA